MIVSQIIAFPRGSVRMGSSLLVTRVKRWLPHKPLLNYRLSAKRGPGNNRGIRNPFWGLEKWAPTNKRSFSYSMERESKKKKKNDIRKERSRKPFFPSGASARRRCDSARQRGARFCLHVGPRSSARRLLHLRVSPRGCRRAHKSRAAFFPSLSTFNTKDVIV